MRFAALGRLLPRFPRTSLRRAARSSAFFDDTVRRHIEILEKEIVRLETQAGELEREITELTGESVMKNNRQTGE